MKARLKTGKVITLEKDCDCITHTGPHWLYMDELERELCGTDARAQIARLDRKLAKMKELDIAELISEEREDT